MILRIPFLPKGEASRPLGECISKAARETGSSEFTVGLILSWFFEEVAAKVVGGELVRIPGFGTFGAGVRKPRSVHEGDADYSVPRFHPSRGFRHHVRVCCPASRARERSLQRYSKRQAASSRRGRKSTVFGAMQQFRAELLAQPGCPHLKSGILP